ncbi:hypothetical protein XELAEV_18005629mg [Xenopus laevis]|uniref:Protein kinase domain-containing protein n=1 Tax=Xenopus laevis TaxID=8355 RepID=A0A974DZK4_XENLA|nr:hypothetical protein XELAEV_18005629mg [Xenopus laevis]
MWCRSLELPGLPHEHVKVGTKDKRNGFFDRRKIVRFEGFNRLIERFFLRSIDRSICGKSFEFDIRSQGNSQKRRRIEAERLPEHMLTNYKFHWGLGRGSFGKVFLASIQMKKERVAVKVIRKTPKEEQKDMIQKEARILKVTSGSPFLCHGYAAFQTNQYAFLVMEYAGGGSLSNLLSIKHHLKKRHIIFYSAELICGLQYLHSLGIIHRDLKPGNILLTCEGHMKIADFGVAAEGVFDDNTIGEKTGTSWYMAPEMLANKKYNAAIDWWSFGIILSEMATGRSPFEDDSCKHDVRSSILTEKPVFPEWMSATLQDLLHKDANVQPTEDEDQFLLFIWSKRRNNKKTQRSSQRTIWKTLSISSK